MNFKTFFIASTLLSFSLFAESQVEKKISERLQVIDSLLVNYDLSGTDYNVNFDYHIGVLNGRTQAYKDCLNLISNSN